MTEPESLERTTRKTIERYAMLEGGEAVVVAVSGGPDSTALLLLLHGMADRLGLRLSVFHLEHGLRGEESRDDAAFVADLCDRLGIPVEVVEADVRSETEGWDRSPQDAARLVRLQRMEEYATRMGADRVATGHTADDQVETFLMRVVQGAGLTGLAGIAPVSGRAIRPLIDTWRDQVLDFCARHGVEPRIDSSNLEPRYLRNRIRLTVVPMLVSEFGEGVRSVILREVESLALDREFFRGEAARALVEVREAGEDGVVLDRERLLALPEALRRGVVRAAWEEMCPSGEEIFHRNPSHRLVLDVLGKVAGGRSGARLDLPGGMVAEREFETVVLRRVFPEEPPDPVRLDVPGSALLWDGTVLEAEPVPRSRVSFAGDPLVEFARGDLGPVLEVRVPAPGDRVHPIGAPGPKKLKDLFVDLKLPRSARKRCPVVTREGEVVWVVGHRLDERFKVGPGDERAVRLRLLRPNE